MSEIFYKAKDIDDHSKILHGFLNELDKAKGNPRMLLILTHGIIELLVNSTTYYRTKLSKKILNDDSRSFPHGVKLVILHELGILDDSDYNLYSWLRKLRNRAAHEWSFKIEDKDLQHLDSPDFRKVDNFDKLCEFLIGRMWNKHIFCKRKKEGREALEINTWLMVTKVVDGKTGQEHYEPI